MKGGHKSPLSNEIDDLDKMAELQTSKRGFICQLGINKVGLF